MSGNVNSLVRNDNGKERFVATTAISTNGPRFVSMKMPPSDISKHRQLQDNLDKLLNYVGHESFSPLSLGLVYWEEVSALLVEKSLLKDPPGGPVKHQDFPQNSLIEHTLVHTCNSII
jgi:hypothetical protein